jgi:mRNA (guanine-N7-)-methyltransferase
MKTNGMNGFEIMSCQFAVHYFFQSEIALQNVFRAFSPFIKKGGYFVGTTVNGHQITNLLKSSQTFQSKLLSITKKYRAIAPRKLYGNQYTFTINDTVDQGNYFNTMGESTEYLVNLKELKRVASEYGFVPVYLNFFETIPGKNTFTTMSDFVSFDEIYSLPKHGNWKGKSLNQEEIVLNNLYSTFVFMKI